MSVNKVILVGHVGRDPEVRLLEGQRTVARFSLATNEVYRDKNGNRIEQTEWHQIEVWDDLARIAEKYVRKGTQLYLEGKIRTNSWKDKETGQEKSTKYIRANAFTLLGPPPSQDGGQEPETTAAGPLLPDQAPDDDLPF